VRLAPDDGFASGKVIEKQQESFKLKKQKSERCKGKPLYLLQGDGIFKMLFYQSQNSAF
jgi:hypothetical protein